MKRLRERLSEVKKTLADGPAVTEKYKDFLQPGDDEEEPIPDK